MNFEVLFDDEVADRDLLLDKHGERRRLHPADGKLFIECERIRPRQIHTDEPICPAAPTGSVRERIVVRSRLQVFEPSTNGVRRERRDPQTADRLNAIRSLVNVAEDQLAFATSVCRAHNLGDALRAEYFLHDIELMLRLLVHHQRPAAGQHRERIASPLFPAWIDFVRLGKRRKVTDGPCNHVTVPMQESIAFDACPQDTRNVAGNGRLLGENADIFLRATHPIMIPVGKPDQGTLAEG